jgi:hypothetical protein
MVWVFWYSVAYSGRVAYALLLLGFPIMAGLADAFQVLRIDERLPVALMGDAMMDDGRSHNLALVKLEGCCGAWRRGSDHAYAFPSALTG